MADNPTTLDDTQLPTQPHPPVPEGVPPVLDEAHIGDIRGALGTIRMDDTGARHGWRSRAMALLAIMGPGLIVMVGDNDAGGVSTYAQAGQNYGTSLLWVLVLLIPVLIVNQEMVIRLGAVTGVGHARLINERFGRFWGWFSVGDLFVLNFLTIVTEFIGVSLALGYFGVSKFVAVPAAAAALVAITATGSFRSWERFMYVFVIANFLVIPLLVLVHPDFATIAHDTVTPSIAGGASSTAVLLIIAIVGTTVAPWQLFFQQSNIIDKRITPRWINYERADTVIGAFVVVVGAGAIISVAAFAFGGTPAAGHFGNAGTVASALRTYVGPAAGACFAIVLLNASLIGAAAVTLATSYAFGDVFGASHSLHRGIKDAKMFYATFALMVCAAAGIVLLPGAPLGLITTSVQALAGVLLPSATVFLLLLCNDRAVLGPWVNAPWLNALAAVIIGVLVELSLVLVASTAFPHVNVTHLFIALSIALVVALAAMGAYVLLRRVPAGVLAAGAAGAAGGAKEAAGAEEVASMSKERRHAWTMPPLALLERPVWSPGRRAAMLLLRGYLVVAVALLVVKTVQLGG
ncbi:MAG TPA: NRAMP family divalent metal transporter [Solirubrobacteraceae bacterium]|jgi:NRAMP (natural resistance-associated macrophage protein)-like metal ion transporter|nr:NRAMP family divalent metal transporter [Solirubrobacteraceae bacterium]